MNLLVLLINLFSDCSWIFGYFYLFSHYCVLSSAVKMCFMSCYPYFVIPREPPSSRYSRIPREPPLLHERPLAPEEPVLRSKPSPQFRLKRFSPKALWKCLRCGNRRFWSTMKKRNLMIDEDWRLTSSEWMWLTHNQIIKESNTDPDWKKKSLLLSDETMN